MARYALRRILQMIPTILAVALLVFIIFSVVPGNFATSMTGGGRRALSPELVAQINAQFGLDKPLPVRFWDYLVRLVQFDLGVSNITVTEARKQKYDFATYRKDDLAGAMKTALETPGPVLLEGTLELAAPSDAGVAEDGAGGEGGSGHARVSCSMRPAARSTASTVS